MFFLALLAWLCLAYAFMSLVEYLLHRWPMHSRAFARRFPWLRDEFYRHAVLHHGHYYNQKFERCADPAARYISVDLSPLFNVIGLSWVWLPLFYFAPLGGTVLACFIMTHAVLWTFIHREMHEPAGRWFCLTDLFRYWRNYHKVHHDHPNKNYNVVCPGADWLFGSYRRPVT
jgi:hypothetical protein